MTIVVSRHRSMIDMFGYEGNFGCVPKLAILVALARHVRGDRDRDSHRDIEGGNDDLSLFMSSGW